MTGHREAGFTLIEVLIALVLFSLIAVAGFTLLSAIVGVQSKTDQRLDRLAEFQRAMQIMTLDFQQVTGPPITIADGAVVIRRYSDQSSTGALVVRYDLASETLRRTLSRGDGKSQPQTLVSGIETLRWLYFHKGAWTDTWPPPDIDGDVTLPEAISIEVQVKPLAGGLTGLLRRVVRLPAVASQ